MVRLILISLVVVLGGQQVLNNPLLLLGIQPKVESPIFQLLASATLRVGQL